MAGPWALWKDDAYHAIRPGWDKERGSYKYSEFDLEVTAPTDRELAAKLGGVLVWDCPIGHEHTKEGPGHQPWTSGADWDDYHEEYMRRHFPEKDIK